MSRPDVTFTRHAGRLIRVWGPGAPRLATLLDAPYRRGGLTVTAAQADDLDAAAQLERIRLVDVTRKDRP